MTTVLEISTGPSQWRVNNTRSKVEQFKFNVALCARRQFSVALRAQRQFSVALRAQRQFSVALRAQRQFSVALRSQKQFSVALRAQRPSELLGTETIRTVRDRDHQDY